MHESPKPAVWDHTRSKPFGQGDITRLICDSMQPGHALCGRCQTGSVAEAMLHAHLRQWHTNESMLKVYQVLLPAKRQANNRYQAAGQASLRLRVFAEGRDTYGV